MKHEFGGVWTQKKLAVLEAYLTFYMRALKGKFRLHYVDAFAGTGSHDPVIEEDQQLLIPYQNFRGSVLTALAVEPAFDEFHFNDLDQQHVEELERIKHLHRDKNIKVYSQDANQFVPDYCSKLGSKDRAVLLLDPYSTQLDWETLRFVADTKRVDLWLLFPISVILRMTPTDGNNTRPEWKNTIDRLLGTTHWEEAIYKPLVPPAIGDLFDDQDKVESSERYTTQELEQWVTNRLKEVFPYIAKPVLLTNKGAPLFLFYFAVSNDDKRAWGLADKVASHIIKNNIGRD